MTPTIERFNSTRGAGAPPRMGERASMLDPDDDRISRLMEAVPITSTEDDLDLEDTDIDMNSVRNNVADALGISRDGRTDLSEVRSGGIQPTQSPTAIDGMDDLDLDNVLEASSASPNDHEDHLADDNSDESDETDIEQNAASGKPTKIYAIAAAILIGIVVVIIIISSFITKQTPKQQHDTQQPQVTTGVQTQRYQTDTVNTTDSTTYQDSMVISKYFYFDQDTCVFVFEGYAENARAFVKAYVDVETYNTYKTGARVSIIYDHITIQGNDYYMKVRVI